MREQAFRSSFLAINIVVRREAVLVRKMRTETAPAHAGGENMSEHDGGIALMADAIEAAGATSAADAVGAPVATSRDNEVTARIQDMGAQFESDITAWRRHFHQHPEVGACEVQTSATLCAELDKLGVEYQRIVGPRPAEFAGKDGRDEFIGTGIIATIRGYAPGAYDVQGNPKKRVALRTDIDALPITELSDVPFRSQNDGVMHACGHDCHMAMMLGAIRMLCELREYLCGEVRVLFQPAEEISIGARDMIAAGALDGVDALYGAHIWSEVAAGTISCEPGPRMAFTDWFRIDIEGVSAHGSMPHKGIDAIVIAAEIIDSLQTIVSRCSSPFEPVVVTVGEIHGGTARNIMAGSAYLTGTVRTWHQGVRERIADRMERIAGKVAHAFGARIEFEFEAGNPSVVNDAACAEVARQAVVKVLGEQAVSEYEGTLAGEDFAEYLNYVPGVFVFVGTNNPAIGAEYPQHSCYYTVDESVLVKGSMVAAQWTCDMLA